MNLHDIIVDTARPAMYINADNKCAGFDDWDRAEASGRPYCIETRPEVIPVDIDAEHLDYLEAFRQTIAANGDPYLEVMSGGPDSPNRHFFIHVPDEQRRNMVIAELRAICGAKPVRVGQKIRPPFTPHRNGADISTPVNDYTVDDFLLWVTGVMA